MLSVSGVLDICIKEFKQISDVSAFKAFFEKYSDLLYITETFSDEAYENMFKTFANTNKESIIAYSDLALAVDTLVNVEKAKIAQFLEELNAASAEGDNEKIETLLTETYADCIPFEIDTSEFKNPGAIYKKMTGITYYSVEEVENVFYAVFEAQRYAEEGRDNAVIMSSVSKYFDGWTVLRSNNFGGVSLSLGDENVATLSAYEGLKSPGKGSVETGLDGYVYQAPGSFGNNIESVAAAVDSANGTVAFNNQDGNFTIKDASGNRAKSQTIITVFDLTKPKGRVTGTLSDGWHNIVIDFTEKGTSFGPLPENLRNKEKLTYRIEKSFAFADVMVKAADAPDTEYVFLGTKATSNPTNSYWFVKFEGDAATAEISNIGVYAATPNVKYDTSGYTLRDNYSFSANGESGHTMQDLLNVTPAVTMGSPVVNANGILELPKGSSLHFGGYNANLTPFDRAEIDITVSVPTGKSIFNYFADNSGNRNQNYYWGLGEVNGTTVRYEKSWETGKFYSLKFVTQVAEHDETGRPRTSASLYVKDAATNKWVCLARNILLEWKQDVTLPQIMFYLQTDDATQKMLVSDFALKTYTKDSGDYSYINNTVDMPAIDYNFSFDYMRINGDDATEFVIGGLDYHQTFQIETPAEDTWYRFYGTVKNTQNTSQKKITLYRADTAGNIVTIAENLPMLTSAGNNGVKFRLSDATTGGIKLKNIRVYNGKALDVISASANGGTATVIADFLNNNAAMSEDATILTGVYNNDVLSGAGMYTLTDDLSAYGTKRVTITDVGYDEEFKVNDGVHILFVTVNKGCSVDFVETDEIIDTELHLRELMNAEYDEIQKGREVNDHENWKKVEYTARVPEKDVQLTGAFGDLFQQNASRIKKCIKTPCYLVPNENKPDDKGWSEWLPAANEGRIIGGAAKVFTWTGDKELREFVDKMVDKVSDNMRDDGFYGYSKEEESFAVNYIPNEENTREVILNSERKNYDRQFWTYGMIAAHKVGNQKALSLVRRMYDWMEDSQYGPNMLLGHNATNAFMGTLVLAETAMGKDEDILFNQRFLDQKYWESELTNRNPVAFYKYPGDRPHCYALLGILALVLEYRLTGEKHYLDVALGGWDVYSRYYKHIGGTTAICEIDGPYLMALTGEFEEDVPILDINL